MTDGERVRAGAGGRVRAGAAGAGELSVGRGMVDGMGNEGRRPGTDVVVDTAAGTAADMSTGVSAGLVADVTAEMAAEGMTATADGVTVEMAADRMVDR
ncbi:hypothetical protein ACIBUY_10075 [Streptomyces sp. NPDC050085]|uniref:hypothetical protein n=1 Tax=Streptomyces sp. NPDC050085 TaxID=3365600 RepID=UPI00378F4ACD